MCPQHWRIVPGGIKAAVLMAFRCEQLQGELPSLAWYKAAAAAVEAVARAEGRPEDNRFRSTADAMEADQSRVVGRG